jgi:chromosome segregation ATPase
MNSNHLKAGEATGGREQKLEEIAELRGELAECWAAIRKYWMEFCGIGIEAGSEVTTIIEGHKFLRAELSRVSRDNEGLQNTNEALRLALSRVSAESDAAQSALCDYTDMLQNARDRNEAAEAERDALRQREEVMNAEYRRVVREAKAVGLTTKLDEATCEVSWVNSRAEAAESELARIKQALPSERDFLMATIKSGSNGDGDWVMVREDFWKKLRALAPPKEGK